MPSSKINKKKLKGEKMNRAKLACIIREVQLLHEAIGGNFGGEIVDLLHRFGRLAKRHQRLCEDYCNNADFEYKKLEKTTEQIKEDFNKLNVFFKDKLNLEIQQDPRGLTVKLSIKNDGNSFEDGIYELLE